ncbi:hypothetical protein M3699_09485 [Peribacillus simplex]|uniref:hypothetical protein n=1 Tax=Peribacillus simplex TaxID=1478 RepID=UPI00203CE069|nr:hypothetical protein [Peribacillus simplex]MCM3674112.1 hypothetical protein [Peribacillus simplex]
METLIILFFSLAIVLLIISFFGTDKVAKLEEDLEQMTLTYMQDIHRRHHFYNNNLCWLLLWHRIIRMHHPYCGGS